ncbi:MAG: FliA/WhiG family RNA polymerase sigma factor [Oscillospiraceae bacterium]|nr:FliA/WhiG family RNA polymerase sigma factor [Oscillospiraceae bacterium]
MGNDKAEIFRKYKETGDLEIRNEIVLLYMDTVRYCAFSLRSVYSKGYDPEDLVNEGVIALIAAVDSFDADRGVKFETYASMKVKGAIIDYIRKQDWVPRQVRRFSKELENAYGVLYHELGRVPVNAELAEFLGLTKEQFARRLADTASANTLSFEELLYEDNFSAYNANNPESGLADSRMYAREQKQIIAQAISELKPKEQQVVSLYYYEKLKLREIADVLGITESRACQIHSKCMLLLRQKLERYIKDLN